MAKEGSRGETLHVIKTLEPKIKNLSKKFQNIFKVMENPWDMQHIFHAPKKGKITKKKFKLINYRWQISFYFIINNVFNKLLSDFIMLISTVQKFRFPTAKVKIFSIDMVCRYFLKWGGDVFFLTRHWCVVYTNFGNSGKAIYHSYIDTITHLYNTTIIIDCTLIQLIYTHTHIYLTYNSLIVATRDKGGRRPLKISSVKNERIFHNIIFLRPTLAHPLVVPMESYKYYNTRYE